MFLLFLWVWNVLLLCFRFDFLLTKIIKFIIFVNKNYWRTKYVLVVLPVMQLLLFNTKIMKFIIFVNCKICTHVNHSIEDCNILVKEIQKIIEDAYSKSPLSKKNLSYKTTEAPINKSTAELLQMEHNFNSLFSTIVWFLEQNPYTNIVSNLDVNFRKVKQ